MFDIISVREEKFSLPPVRVPGWVWKFNWQRQILRRKAHKAYWIFTCTWSLHKRMSLEGVTRPESFYLSDKEIIHWWRTDKAEGFGIGVVNGDEVTRKTGWVYQGLLVRISWPPNSPSLQIRPPGTGKVASTWSFRICFKEEEWGKSDASPALLFSQIPSV